MGGLCRHRYLSSRQFVGRTPLLRIYHKCIPLNPTDAYFHARFACVLKFVILLSRTRIYPRRCLDAFTVALHQAFEGQRWYTSTAQLQLASLQFCRACRSVLTLYMITVDVDTPEHLWDDCAMRRRQEISQRRRPARKNAGSSRTRAAKKQSPKKEAGETVGGGVVGVLVCPRSTARCNMEAREWIFELRQERLCGRGQFGSRWWWLLDRG